MSRLRFVRPLSHEELDELEQAAGESDDAGLRMRCRAVLLSARGETTADIARATRVDNSTVHRWLDRYEREGLAGLRTQPRSGRPVMWDEAYEYELVETVRHDPRWWGWDQPAWTANLLAEHMAQRRGIRLGSERVRELLLVRGIRLNEPQEPEPGTQISESSSQTGAG